MRSGPAVLLALLLLTGCSGEPVRLDGRSAEQAVTAFVAVQQDDGRRTYETPTSEASQQLATAVVALGGGRRAMAERALVGLAYRVVELTDAFAIVPSELPDKRGWGMFVVRPDGAAVAIEVPHPRADLETERLGAALMTAADARYLLVAGAHRDASDGRADVAHEESSAFAVVHRLLAEQHVPVLQLHGFAAGSLPGVDVVVSPGAAALSDLARAVADRAEAADLAVCRAWESACGQLEGRTNVQGRASAEAGAAFVHLELTRSLRERDRATNVVGLLAGALRP